MHEEMISHSSLRAVRWCSDIDGGRRWKKNEGCNVWGASKLSSSIESKAKCGGMMNLSQAKNFCESSGARLCTSEEVANGSTEQTEMQLYQSNGLDIPYRAALCRLFPPKSPLDFPHIPCHVLLCPGSRDILFLDQDKLNGTRSSNIIPKTNSIPIFYLL